MELGKLDDGKGPVANAGRGWPPGHGATVPQYFGDCRKLLLCAGGLPFSSNPRDAFSRWFLKSQRKIEHVALGAGLLYYSYDDMSPWHVLARGQLQQVFLPCRVGFVTSFVPPQPRKMPMSKFTTLHAAALVNGPLGMTWQRFGGVSRWLRSNHPA